MANSEATASVADIIGKAKTSINGMRHRLTVCIAALDPEAAAYVGGTNEEVRTILDEDIGGIVERLHEAFEEIEAKLVVAGNEEVPHG